MQLKIIIKSLTLLIPMLFITSCGSKIQKNESLEVNNITCNQKNIKKNEFNKKNKVITNRNIKIKNSKNKNIDKKIENNVINSNQEDETITNKNIKINDNELLNKNSEINNFKPQKISMNLPNDNKLLENIKQNNTIYFDFNKASIDSKYFEILNLHSTFLSKNPLNKIIIEGYTDERGAPEYNITLGERRANAAKAYLQSKGIPTEQINIISYGKEKQIIDSSIDNESNYAKNRRVVLVH